MFNENEIQIKSLADAQKFINILQRRSIRDKIELNLLAAQIDLLRTPWWHRRRRRAQKAWITSLSKTST